MTAGRRCKRTPELTEKLCKYIRRGNPDKVACGLVGVSQSTFYRWMAEGEVERDGAVAEAQERGEPGDDVVAPEGSAWEFRERIARARLELHDTLIGDFLAQSKDGKPRATEWLMARKFPKLYPGQSQRIEVTGTDGGPLEVHHDLLDMSPEQLAALVSGTAEEEPEE